MLTKIWCLIVKLRISKTGIITLSLYSDSEMAMAEVICAMCLTVGEGAGGPMGRERCVVVRAMVHMPSSMVSVLRVGMGRGAPERGVWQ